MKFSFLRSLGKLHFKWIKLTPELKNGLAVAIVRVSGELNHIKFSMLIHGLNFMEVELADETRSCLLASFERTASSMNEQSIANSI